MVGIAPPGASQDRTPKSASAEAEPSAPARLQMQWRVHSPSLLKEVVDGNPAGWALAMPMMIFQRLLAQVAIRAGELGDPRLNALMCRLTLYDIADPESDGYDPERTNAILDGSPPDTSTGIVQARDDDKTSTPLPQSGGAK